MANNYESLKTDGHYTLAYRIFLKMRNWVESLFYGERVHFCTCTEYASVDNKTVTSTDTFTLKTGTMIIVDFQHGFNLYNTLNVNGTGAKNMRYSGLSTYDSSLRGAVNLHYRIALLMVYDGETWSIVSEIGDYYKTPTVVGGSSVNYYFPFVTTTGGYFDNYETTTRLYYNINNGTLTVKNNSDNDPYMSYKNDDIVINSSTWDGTNTSLKTTLGTLDQIDDSYNYQQYQNLPSSTKMQDKLFIVDDAPDLDPAILNLVYPVGTYYETSDTTFNPNVTWGGTWVLEDEGLVHISSGTNYVVSANTQDGGSAQITYTPSGSNSGGVVQGHKLVASEIPKFAGSAYFRRTSGGGDIVFSATGICSRSTISSSNTSYNQIASSTVAQRDQLNINFGGDGTHNHDFTQPTFTGTQATLDNMQPYKIVNRWHRTA